MRRRGRVSRIGKSGKEKEREGRERAAMKTDEEKGVMRREEREGEN